MEENKDLNNSVTENGVKPEELSNKEESFEVKEESTPNNEETITLTPKPAEEEAPVKEISNEPSAEIGPAQTDLNQVPPTPEASPFPTQDVTGTGFEEKKDNKKNLKKPLLIIGCLIVLALLGYFVIYPMIVNNFMSSPKNVFEASINKITTQVNKRLDQVDFGSSMYDVDLSLDTNIEELKQFVDYKYKFKAGMDSKNKRIEANIAMVGKDNKEIGALFYVKNDYLFYKLSSDERIVKYLNMNEVDGYKEWFENNETVNSEDLKYLTTKFEELLFKDLKDEDFIKENNYLLKVNGSEIKVTRNGLVIDKAMYTTICKSVIEGLYADSKSMDIIEKLGTTKEQYKAQFVDIDYSKIDDELNLVVNVYSNKADVIGFDFGEKENKLMYFYTNEGNFEGYLFPGDKNNEVSFIGVKEGEVTNAVLKSAGEEVAKFKINLLTENEIKLDYSFNYDADEKMTGIFNLKANGNTIDVECSAKSGSEFIKFLSKVNITPNVKIAEFDDSTAVTLSEEDQNKMLSDFLETTKGSPLGFYTENLGGMTYNSIQSYNTPEENNF